MFLVRLVRSPFRETLLRKSLGISICSNISSLFPHPPLVVILSFDVHFLANLPFLTFDLFLLLLGEFGSSPFLLLVPIFSLRLYCRLPRVWAPVRNFARLFSPLTPLPSPLW